MDLPALISSRQFKALPAVGQLLPPAYTADLSENEEIYNFDNDDDYDDDGLFFSSQI
jgi:hypothetical protein